MNSNQRLVRGTSIVGNLCYVEQSRPQRTCTWRSLISREATEHNDQLDDFKTTLNEGELDESFVCDYGANEGRAFTAWSARRVYFPVTYDGLTSCGSAPRHPCDEKTLHQGGPQL